MKDSGPWLLIIAVAVLGMAAAMAYGLVRPYWGQPETSTLLAGIVGCPTILLTVGVIFLGLHWRDERQAAREEKQTAKRGRAIDRHGQDAQVLGLNAAVTRQAIDVISAMAQAQARQSVAQLGGLRTDQFMQRSIEPPTQEQLWFTGDWDYGDEPAETVEASSRIAYL
jgi:high-affinity Fe2+/Pb2+ permease